MPPPGKTVRVQFQREHDTYLARYLAKYSPSKQGRSGHKLFKCLVANENNAWPWARHHTWQSWRERYVKNAAYFDTKILKYQNLSHADKRKQPAEPTSIENLAPNPKRIRLEEEEGSPSSEAREATQRDNASSSRSISTSKSKHPHEPPETPSQAPQPTREPEPMNARRTPPAASSPRSNANGSMSATKEPTALQTRHDTLEIQSSSPDRLVAPPEDVTYDPHRHVKRIKVRPGTPSDMFASEPPSPKTDAAAPVVGVQGPSTPSAPSAGTNGAPVATSVYPRAPPRVVDSLHGQVLVDQKGHVPRTLLHGEEDGVEEEEDKTRWPPARGRTAQQRGVSGPDVKVDAHHAFSQPQPQPPSELVSRTNDEPPHDRRSTAAEVSGQARQVEAESERREVKIRNGASPVKCIVTAAPPSDPFSVQIPKLLSKVFKFPAPRASTRSPFRPEPSSEERQPQPPARTKAARHPALTRIRRQTIGHGHGNGNGRERERRRNVPSVDLVALSRSSTSARSHSRSPAEASVPARPPRWSLPAFVHAMPWVLDERDVPEPGYGDLWGGRKRTASLVGTSTPRLAYTPSPTRSIGNGNVVPATTTTSAVSLPYPPDVELAASHGLASILAHMSANHRLALSVVEAVYDRMGNLREADEILKGMREAAEGFGEREIERRVRERCGGRGVGRGEECHQNRNGKGKSQLRYVVASKDGEGSEYSPPETSRAAMWKRKSESESFVERESGEEDDEEAAEGREVEEELRDRDEDEGEGDNEADHEFSRHVPEGNDEVRGQDEDGDGHNTEWSQRVIQALLEDTRFAQETERRLGKARYRRHIARIFT